MSAIAGMMSTLFDAARNNLSDKQLDDLVLAGEESLLVLANASDTLSTIARDLLPIDEADQATEPYDRRDLAHAMFLLEEALDAVGTAFFIGNEANATRHERELAKAKEGVPA